MEIENAVNQAKKELASRFDFKGSNAEILLDEHKGVLTVPENAVMYDKDKKASVEIPDPKGKEGKDKIAVNIGISNGAKTEVLGGLKEGDQVVLQ